jgi:IclR helix-turn-helix domain
MDEAARILARLIASGAVPRTELPELDHPLIREEVEARLERCGFSLASSAYSDHYGIRLLSNADAAVLDTVSNLNLGSNACALLTILWAKLALQKRTASDTQDTPGNQRELPPDQQRDKAQEYQPSIRFETLAQEFGRKLGGRTRLKTLLGQLRRLKFISYRRLEKIHAGPLLELAIDGEKMIGFIRSRVLSQYLESGSSTAAPSDSTPEINDRLVQLLSAAGQPLSLKDIAERSGIPRRELKRILRDLRQDQIVETIGARAKTAYRVRARDS